MKAAKARKPYWYPYRNIVDKVIEEHGMGSPSFLGVRLAPVLGRPVTKQVVVNWRMRGQFSREVIEAVHKVTRIPYSILLGDSGPPAETEEDDDENGSGPLDGGLKS